MAGQQSKNAKLLNCLGLEKSPSIPYLYHKNHIDKVMAVAFTAFAFDDSNIDNGGHGIDFKLGFFRCCAALLD